MDLEGKPLRIIGTFILGVATTLTLIAFYQAADFNGEKSLQILSYLNGTTVNATLQEVRININFFYKCPFLFYLMS
jgi:hypothetical protein